MRILYDFLGNFDEITNVVSTSGAHHKPSCSEDMKLILNQLNVARIFDVIPKTQVISKAKGYFTCKC